MRYYEKLKDPRWQRKRLKIMERDGFECDCCGDGENTLNVHHWYYLPDTEPWEYPDDALVTLCRECHEMYEEVKPKWLRLMRFGIPWRVGRIADLWEMIDKKACGCDVVFAILRLLSHKQQLISKFSFDYKVHVSMHCETEEQYGELREMFGEEVAGEVERIKRQMRGVVVFFPLDYSEQKAVRWISEREPYQIAEDLDWSEFEKHHRVDIVLQK